MTQTKTRDPVLRRSLRLITFGVCFCMVYVPATASPMFTEFLREMGATAFHFGLLAGIPMSLFVMQFVGALINNQIRNRKVPFIVLLDVAGQPQRGFLRFPIGLYRRLPHNPNNKS